MNSLEFSRVVIQEFKSFRGKHVFQLDRGPGIFHVTGINKVNKRAGANGAGKTTLWDAITWCLWGSTGRDKRPSHSIQPWKFKGRTRVAVVFSNGDKFVRTRRPNALTHNGTVIEDKAVSKLIGMSEAMFRRTVILAQFGTLFMDLGPEEQSRMFNEALGLDVWLQASTNASKARKANLEQQFACRDELSGLTGQIKATREGYRDAKDRFDRYEKNRGTLLEGAIKFRSKLKAKLPDTARLDTRLLNIKQDILELQTTTLRLTNKSGKLENILEDLTSKSDSLQTMKTCPECGQVVSDSHREQQRKSCNQLFTDSSKILKKVNTRLEEGKRVRQMLEEEKDKIYKELEAAVSIQADLEIARRKVKELKADQNPHEKAKKELRTKLVSLKQASEEHGTTHSKLEQELEQIDYWIEAFKEIRLSLIDQVLDELSMTVNSHAANLGVDDGWRIEFNTEKETKSGNITVVFNVLLYPPGQDEPVRWQSYSGGESQRWQLAVAFGLSEIVLARAGVSPNIEVLDEPWHGLSPEGIDDLLEHLKDRAQELKRSIYIVEQHSLEHGMFNEQITVVKNKHGSHIKEN